MEKKEPITVVGTTGADSTTEKSKEFTRSGVLTGLFCSTYVGHEFDLRYHFYLREAESRRQNLLEPLDQAYLAGNGENHDVEIRREFEKGDKLIIEVVNNDSSLTLHHQARVDVDYDPSLLSALRGLI